MLPPYRFACDPNENSSIGESNCFGVCCDDVKFRKPVRRVQDDSFRLSHEMQMPVATDTFSDVTEPLG